ncbi:MAG: SAM-dependent methyltransferase, partial [Lachnospiraceae bacterium]|nr:SAM-dependent methyltransferase [Lachnospiraceae bacterium]
KNLDLKEAPAYLTDLMEHSFKQAQVETEGWSGQLLVSKKGKASVKIKRKAETRKNVSTQSSDLEVAWKKGISHNRKKRYILEEGIAVPFLVDLGVQTKEGKIVNSRYDKFRQINRFLEFIEDILPKLDKSRENVILDFGCGKSYLTFAMYYYLKELKGYPVRIIGLDLKDDVIKKCNDLARRYDYEKLSFYTGDIASYEGVDQVDMVVTLHACDVATDYAMEKAVRWGAKVILSVPCCQHELNGQLENELLKPIFQYGIIKERTAALFTDAIRAQILESVGYRTQILEFIDMEHTPKNLLIRAVKQGTPKDNKKELEAIMNELHIEPMLYRLLNE